MNLYIVIGTNNHNRILGVYPSSQQAKARCRAILRDEDSGYRDVHYNVVKDFDVNFGAESRMVLDYLD